MSRATMTRRGFLKSTAAMGAVTALGISAADSLTAVDPAHADEASDVKIIKTSCRACIASCAVLAHVPFINLFAPALAGLAFVHYLLSALRLARRTENIIEVN